MLESQWHEGARYLQGLDDLSGLKLSLVEGHEGDVKELLLHFVESREI